MASSSNQANIFPSDTHWTYDVFLSFRGKDTRYNFTDHLYVDLKRKGIVTFRDNSLEKGEAISKQLMEIIEKSRFSVVVLSKNYASSSWCLEELVKILECKRQKGHRVLPVFYQVDPFEVRRQAGEFGEAFSKHERRYHDNLEKVERWRNALIDVANLSGWTIWSRYESKCIEEIAGLILSELLLTGLTFPKDLVGMDRRFVELSSYLQLESDDVIMVGISGMGGIGKTTVAHAVYDRLVDRFEGSSFLEHIKGNTLLHLQRQLLTETLKDKDIEVSNTHSGARAIANRLKHKRIFLVLDDVDHMKQLEMLAGSCDWFGPGSRIIITSRDEHLLLSHGARKIYRAEHLNGEEALQLFVNKAFKGDHSLNSADYTELTLRAIKYASGLPLAIRVLGSFLCGRSISQWRAAMDRMEEFPDEEVFGILRLSYDGLNESQKKIFLDIACFFRSKTKVWLTTIMASFGFHPDIDVEVLIEKSLITISDEKVEMHDLIQKMGWEIVHKENPEEPGKRSRLWLCKDIHPMLANNKGTKRVEGIVLVSFSQKKQLLPLDAQAFSKMERLRYLQIIYDVQLPQGLAYLSNELRYMDWHDYPLKSFPSTFQPKSLLEIHLPHSKIEHLFHCIKSLEKLKIINLSYSRELLTTPNLESLPNLEELNLEGCTRLSKVSPSILVHEKLVLLDLRGCINLQYLPNKICLRALKLLNLCGCTKLKKFPDIIGNMENLLTLSLSGTAVREIPLSIRSLTGIELLDLQFCENLIALPSGICDLLSLRKLLLSGCSKFEHLPDNIGKLAHLEMLDLRATSVTWLPPSIAYLKNLEWLCLSRDDLRNACSHRSKLTKSVLLLGRSSKTLLLPSWSSLCSLKKLELSYCNLTERALPHNLGCFTSLEELCLSGNDFGSIPESIVYLVRLKVLLLNDCGTLVTLPKLPSSLTCVEAENCSSLEKVPDPLFTCISKIVKLNFINCFKIANDKSLSSTMLKDYIHSHTPRHVEDHRVHAYEITLPRNRLPEWFQHRSMGKRVKADIPPKFCTSVIKGVVVAAVFGHLKAGADNKRCLSGLVFSSRCPPICCKLLIYDGTAADYELRPFSQIGYDSPIKSNHLWMGYCFVDIKQCNSLEAVLGSEDWQDLEVKMCGIHLIYGQDKEDVLQLISQSASCGDEFGQEELEPYKAYHLHWIMGLFLAVVVLWIGWPLQALL